MHFIVFFPYRGDKIFKSFGGGVNFQRGNGNQPRMKLWKNNLNFVYSVLTVCTETLVA